MIRRGRSILFGVTLVVFATGWGIADTKPEAPVKVAKAEAVGALPTADSLIEKYMAAVGGKEAALKVTSRYYKGTFEMPAMGLKGVAQIYAKAPNKTLSVMEIPGFGTIQQGYNGQIGWSQDPLTGLRELKDAELAMMKRLVEFHRDVKIRDLYPKMTVKEKVKLGDVDTYLVEAVPTEGTPEMLYFDLKDGLLVRTDFEFESPQGKMLIETYLEDYRAVDGVKMPFVLKQKTAAFSIVTKIEEVKQNVKVEDSKFDKPKAP